MYYYLALAVIGYYGYNKYKPKVDMLIIGGTFQLVKIYHAIKDYYGINTEEKNDEIVEEVRKYLYIKDGEIEEMNKNDSPKKEELDFIVVEEKDRIKIVEPTISLFELKTINIEKPEKIFLQVIYCPDEGDEIDINHNLKLFYVLNNKILGYKFLKWYMNKYHNYKLKNKNYKIKIMDKNVKMFELKSSRMLFLKEDGIYDII
tara:strand:+ start:904 stop:1512 length:609 start_codon:yes stop_codon:yes gene_type:complete